MIADEPQLVRGAAPLERDGLIPALQWLDAHLGAAVVRAREAFGTDGTVDRFRGLYISDSDVDRLLARSPATPMLWERNGTGPGGFHARLDWLAAFFGLLPFDCAVLLLSLAPEVDLRYERLYAYLQDDVTRKRPAVDLALSLFCPAPEERLATIERFLGDGPLVRHHLIELAAESSTVRPPLLAHNITTDPQILHFLLGYSALDERIAPYVTLWKARESGEALTPGQRPVLAPLFQEARRHQASLRLYLHGPAGSGRRQSASAAAAACHQSLLELHVTSLPPDDDAIARLLALAVREAWLRHAVLCLSDADALFTTGHASLHARLGRVLAAYHGVLVLTGEVAWVPGTLGLSPVVPIAFSLPGVERRRQFWRDTLQGTRANCEARTVSQLASRFRLTRPQVADAVFAAVAEASLRRGSKAPHVKLAPRDLFAAARRQSGHALAALATRIEPRHVWRDLVLPESALQQLQELRQRVINRDRVLGEWGFGTHLSRGKGVNALFSGASGTGKTMAAEIVAGDLGLDLYQVELAGVVSKYIGETEKNLDRIFQAAERTDGIVFFDEADALFGKRSEVHDSHDRYANLEISYLLQRMEEYDGVAILSTNLRGNLDQAFVRRLAFTVHFPFPDEHSRRAIWERVWPAGVPLAKDVDLDDLAIRFSLTGGSIKNIALAAAFLAAADGTSVGMTHLLRAVQREYEKVGKVLTPAELSGDADDEDVYFLGAAHL